VLGGSRGHTNAKAKQFMTTQNTTEKAEHTAEFVQEYDCMRCEETFTATVASDYCPKCSRNMNRTDMQRQSAKAEFAQHTPGPWKADGDLDGVRQDYRENRCIVTEDFDYDDRTGSIIGVLRGHGPELRANARLIAAAPELLAAAKAWELARNNGGISMADLYEAAWQKTQTAIARAEGRQP